jgi:hypothetical protein
MARPTRWGRAAGASSSKDGASSSKEVLPDFCLVTVLSIYTFGHFIFIAHDAASTCARHASDLEANKVGCEQLQQVVLEALPPPPQPLSLQLTTVVLISIEHTWLTSQGQGLADKSGSASSAAHH